MPDVCMHRRRHLARRLCVLLLCPLITILGTAPGQPSATVPVDPPFVSFPPEGTALCAQAAAQREESSDEDESDADNDEARRCSRGTATYANNAELAAVPLAGLSMSRLRTPTGVGWGQQPCIYMHLYVAGHGGVRRRRRRGGQQRGRVRRRGVWPLSWLAAKCALALSRRQLRAAHACLWLSCQRCTLRCDFGLSQRHAATLQPVKPIAKAKAPAKAPIKPKEESSEEDESDEEVRAPVASVNTRCAFRISLTRSNTAGVEWIISICHLPCRMTRRSL